jgi:hypothetical protein
MHKYSRGRSTHADRLERWLGKSQVEALSAQFRNFYWPVAVHGVPGEVYVMPGGDFAGEIKAGYYLSKEDGAVTVLKKLRHAAELKVRRFKALGTLIDLVRAGDRRLASIGAFATIDAVVAAYTGGKGQQINFSKTGTAPTAIAGAIDMWQKAGYPAAGAAGSAAPGGKAWSVADAGAMPLQNLGGAGTMHYLNWSVSAGIINNSLLLYDRIFSVAAGAALSTPSNVAVTGVPTRYQNATPGNVAYIGGNFMYPVNSTPTTAMAATAHNWSAGGGAGVGCRYTDEANNATDMTLVAGIASCAGAQIDLVLGYWFAPLNAGDVGVKNILNMLASAAVATAGADWVIGHPIAVNACPVANLACLDDGLYTSMNLTHIEDSACLSFIELPKPATNATVYSGILRVVGE